MNKKRPFRKLKNTAIVLLILIGSAFCSLRRLSQQGFQVNTVQSEDKNLESYTHPRCQSDDGNPISKRYSYMASLQLQIGGQFSHLCGAVLISPRLLLTQAHCIWIKNSTVDFRYLNQQSGIISSNIPLYAAISPLCRHQQGVQRSLVAGYYIHPDYLGEDRSGNDLAILIMQEGAPLGSVFANYHAAKTIQLSKIDGLIALGWGATGTEELGDLDMYQNQIWPVKEVEMFEYDSGLCNAEIQVQTPQYQLNKTSSLCAYPRGATMLCQGDGGGPLIWPGCEANEDVLVGIVSWSQDMSCMSQIGQPFIFSRLSAYISWIDNIIGIEEGPQLLQQLYQERRPELFLNDNTLTNNTDNTLTNNIDNTITNNTEYKQQNLEEDKSGDLSSHDFISALNDLQLHGLFTQGGQNKSVTDELIKQNDESEQFFVHPKLVPQNSNCPTLVEVASEYQQLAAFLQAVDGAGLADLMGDSEFVGTVFAPNNGAMTPVFAILPSLATYSQYINAVNGVFGGYMYLHPNAQAQPDVQPMSQRDLLEQLLNIMIIPNLYLRSENMQEGMTLSTLAFGQSVMIHDGDIGDMLKVGPVASIMNGTFMGANIIQPNIIACKAVLHIIDAVM